MWIYVPLASAPVEEGSKSASSWPFPMLARCAGLNGKASAKESWYRVWKRASWLKLLCGRISEPSTAEAGVERWISSLRDTHASHLARRVHDVAKTILGTCGPTFIELSRRYVPPSSFWRTSQGTFDLGLAESCEISESQATELRRLSSQRRKWARATNGNGCLSWASPTARIVKGGGPTTERKDGKSRMDMLGYQSEQWQTPALDSFRSRGGDRKDEMGLDQEARHWKTPFGMSTSSEAGGGGEFAKEATQWGTPGVHNSPDASPNSSRESDLREQVKDWPTARAEDSESAGRRHGRDVDDTLTAATRGWMTPSGLDVKAGAYTYDQHDKNKPRASLVGLSRSFPQAPTKPSDGPKSSQSGPNSRRRLNPAFVAWLMGWPPLEGDGFEPSETALYRYSQRMRSAYLWLVCSEKSEW